MNDFLFYFNIHNYDIKLRYHFIHKILDYLVNFKKFSLIDWLEKRNVYVVGCGMLSIDFYEFRLEFVRVRQKIQLLERRRNFFFIFCFHQYLLITKKILHLIEFLV